MNFSQKKLPKILALLLAFLLSAPLGACVTANAEGEEAQPAGERILHVKAGGEGDGSTAEAPMADIGGAFSALSESGGKIIVYGRYELASASAHDKTLEAFVEPAHSAKITVSGVDAFLECKENYRYYMSGSTQFEHIGISGSGTLIIAARYNPLCMGDGINIVGCSDGVYLIGGYNGANSGLTEESLSKNSSIEIRSGSYRYVAGYNKGTASTNCTGEANISVSGGKINCIAAGISNLSPAFTQNTMKKLNVKVTGGEIYKICDTDMASYGTLSELSLDYSGGAIENVIIPDTTSAQVGFTEEMSTAIAPFLRYFDTYKKGDGEVSATDKIKVACVGDSITAGVRAEGEADTSYPAKLGEMLGDAYEVGNFGEGGATVINSSESAYINTQKYKDSQSFGPSVVFIMLGTNDLSTLISDATAKDRLYSDMLSLIQSYSALESKPVIYLLSPTQRTDSSELDAALRDILVPLYKQIAEQTQVGYIDIYEISKSIKNQFPDAIHPNATAASHIATWLYGAVVTNSNINGINPNTTHVELTIGEAQPPVTTPAPAPAKAKDSSAGLVVAMLLFVLGEAGYFTYLAIKKRGERTGETEAEAQAETEKDNEQENEN